MTPVSVRTHLEGPAFESPQKLLTVDETPLEAAESVATQPATPSERRLALALIGTLVVATLLALLRHNPGAAVLPAFTPLFIGSTGMADALAAALLYNLYRIDGQRVVLYAGAAYLTNALLIIGYGLTFPGNVDSHGSIGNLQSAAFLWLVWHFFFALLIAAGHLRPEPARSRRQRDHRTTGHRIAATTVRVGRDRLPVLLEGGHFTPLFEMLTLAVSCCTIATIAAVLHNRRLSSLQLWLVVALAASALDTGLNAAAQQRFSEVWYVGKIEQFVTATVVLFSMLGAWSSVHARANELAKRLATALAQRRELQDGFDREHRTSMAFQHAALPHDLPIVSGLSFSAIYRAASNDVSVGGDWYDAFTIDDGRIVLSVGDVMGSGLPAAVTMNAVRQSMRGAAQLFPDPIAILDAADRALRSERPQSIVTACVAILDTVTRSITFASAGHPAPLWRLPDGQVLELGRSGLPLGLRSMLKASPDVAQTMSVSEPSMLVFYTDGLTEATRDSLDGETRLRSLLAGDAFLAAGDPASAIADSMLGQSFDDVAIMTVLIDGDLHLMRRDADRGKLHWSFLATDGARAGVVRREMFECLISAGATEAQIISGELVFSELVANVQRHCGGLVDVVLDVRRPVPVLHVLDDGPGFAFVSRLPPSMLSESGRGLFIVTQLTRDFSVSVRPGGGSHARAVLSFSLPEARVLTDPIS